MMIFTHFTSQIIMLAVGFGVGYGLLLSASKQKDNLKSVGRVLGWVLIVMAIIMTMYSGYFSMKFSKKMMMHSCPCQRMTQHHGCPMMEDDESQSDDEIENKGNEDFVDNQEKQEYIKTSDRDIIKEEQKSAKNGKNTPIKLEKEVDE